MTKLAEATHSQVRDVVAHMIRERQSTEDRAQQESFERMCSNYLERYFYLLVFNSYLATITLQQDSGSPSLAFTEWVKTKSEISTLLHHMHANPQRSLKIALYPDDPAIDFAAEAGPGDQPDEDLRRENEMKKVIIDRTGDVLVTNTILKADHFPGCQRKGAVFCRTQPGSVF